MCENCTENNHIHVCKICGKGFKNINGLSKHLTRAHKISYLDYKIKYEGLIIPKCPYCGKDCRVYKGVIRNTCGSNECVDKLRCETNHEKYGADYLSQCPEIKEKIKESFLQHFGVDRPSKSPIIKQKMQHTCKKHFGYENPNQSPEIREKSKQTSLKKYGKEYPMQCPEIHQKTVDTLKERYNVDNPSFIPGSNEKKIETCKKRFGAENYNRSKEGKERSLNRSLKKCLSRFSVEFDDIRIEGEKVVGTCKKCGHVEVLNSHFSYQRQRATKVPVCTMCNPLDKQYSVAEKELCGFIKSIYNGQILENDRTVLGDRRELDIYLPENNLAFEFNGDYWHSDEMLVKKHKPLTYHDDKVKDCLSRGINLIYVWEHDWDNDRNKVKSMIRSLLANK